MTSAIHIIALLAFVFLTYKHFLKRPYVLYFRENVAKSFIELVDSSLSYSPEPPINMRSWILSQYHNGKFDGEIFGVARQMRPMESMGSPGLSNFITGEIEGHPFQLCCMSLHGADTLAIQCTTRYIVLQG